MSSHLSVMDDAAALTKLNNSGSKASCQSFFPSCKGGCWFSGSPLWLTVNQGDAMDVAVEERPSPLVEWEIKPGWGRGVEWNGKFSVILNACVWLSKKWFWIWWNCRAVRSCTDHLVQLLGFIGEEINKWVCLGGLVCDHIILRPTWADTKTFSFKPNLSLYETTWFSSNNCFFNRTPFFP